MIWGVVLSLNLQMYLARSDHVVTILFIKKTMIFYQSPSNSRIPKKKLAKGDFQTGFILVRC